LTIIGTCLAVWTGLQLGRLFQLDAGPPKNRWLLVEKPMLISLSLSNRRIIYENNRVILAERQPAAARRSY
jgi:hypothetical protein